MINEEIRDREVRVIGADGAQLGVLPTQRALELAEEAGLDLVKIVPNAQPPVCKLMDYDKHRYEQAKREREMRKNQKVISVKEVQLSATIEENAVLTFAAPRAGTISVAETAARLDGWNPADFDGAGLSVYKDGERIWPAEGDNPVVTDTPVTVPALPGNVTCGGGWRSWWCSSSSSSS